MSYLLGDVFFLETTLWFSLLIGLTASVLGTFVLVNRMNYLSSGFSHASLGGIGLGLFFGYSVSWFAAGFALFLGVLVVVLYNKHKTRFDSYIDLLYAFGMSLGAVFIQITPTAQKDFSSFLFGSLLLIGWSEVYSALALLILLVGYLYFFYSSLVGVFFDREFSLSLGPKIKWVEYSFILLLSFYLPFMVRNLGLTLTIALLSTAPLILERKHNNMMRIIFWSCLFNWFFLYGGIAYSYWLDLPLGGTASLLAIAVFVLFQITDKLRQMRVFVLKK